MGQLRTLRQGVEPYRTGPGKRRGWRSASPAANQNEVLASNKHKGLVSAGTEVQTTPTPEQTQGAS